MPVVAVTAITRETMAIFFTVGPTEANASPASRCTQARRRGGKLPPRFCSAPHTTNVTRENLVLRRLRSGTGQPVHTDTAPPPLTRQLRRRQIAIVSTPHSPPLTSDAQRAQLGIQRHRNLRVVQILLGLENLGTTQRYTAVDDGELRAAMTAALDDAI